ncbi:galactose-3-O-sulfotransferase 3-like [Liolophura sinensis]|uniref:galactose-3-O-sulfotransferase 3-like n=1 Tax=Liolophura sinensis TaxID=3198878 RepID=UPI0031588B84
MEKITISSRTTFIGLATATVACVLLYSQDFLPLQRAHITWQNVFKGQKQQQHLQAPPSRASHTKCTLAHTSLAFLKVHKAGSTTIMNILQRFAWDNNLLVALPSPSHIIHSNFKNLLFLPKGRNSYDMLFNHVHHYDRKKFAKLLPADAKYIGIVREPLSLTISAFEYYRVVWRLKRYTKIPGNDKLREYLRHREKYDNSPGSFTNNRMAFDFGLPGRMFRNRTFITKYLKKLDSEFDLVMILEYFAESLIFLKRLMCWKLKDVLYIKRNAMKNKRPHIVFSKEELSYHKNFSMADTMLYDHFLSRFKLRLTQENREFWEEVSVFKGMLGKTESYCLSVKNNGTDTHANSSLLFQETKFNDVFAINRNDCSLMLISEIPFVRKSRWKHAQMLSDANKKTFTG